MKNILLTTIVLAGFTATLAAQTAAQPAAPLDYEVRVKSVESLKAHIAQREDRFQTQKKDLLADLRQRRREIALPGEGGGREVGMSEASDLRNMIEDAAGDLRQDFNDLFRKLDDLDRERTKLRSLENNLKAREEWLKQNPPPAK